MRENIECEERSVYSDSLAKPMSRKRLPKKANNGVQDPFYDQFDNEEDYLLTHLAEVIYQNKK
jgi:hypothetical protein